MAQDEVPSFTIWVHVDTVQATIVYTLPDSDVVVHRPWPLLGTDTELVLALPSSQVTLDHVADAFYTDVCTAVQLAGGATAFGKPVALCVRAAMWHAARCVWAATRPFAVHAAVGTPCDWACTGLEPLDTACQAVIDTLDAMQQVDKDANATVVSSPVKDLDEWSEMWVPVALRRSSRLRVTPQRYS